ncbi:alkaline phosphatase family protein [Streptomonospora litoralis]|uniref:Type I phosphodiesterase / nucleotide pyrophosphatase n=1 Tax=Streptomonospora litoralis TaxID=2498135 RepID=A0A4P6Q3I7_9ACTN|nr:nucleotide pyrophosphatase/phosphodiesterase family protein [Streptomonospora litoralis]QBI55248.1 Type I phosphodiesterase / nucleotide pyrophosphatase [Streptomonospora litoralis]
MPVPTYPDDLKVPSYEESLAALSTSVLASLGVAGEPDPLRLPPVRRACVLLVDGMGWQALGEYRVHAPFLAELLETGTHIAAGCPTTTATSLATMGTGRVPGHHGVVGYQVAVPGTERVLNQLRWGDPDIVPEDWQPHATAYERAERAGVRTAYIADGAYRGSGLSRASARGARYVGADSATELAVRAGEALGGDDRVLAFVYHSDLDSFGHVYGVDSPYWRLHLGHVDRLAEQIADSLPPDSALYITADHGMVDTAPDTRVDVESEPAFAAGVRLRAGEPRARHLYTREGAAADVAATWRDLLGERALVLTREEAVADGLFGDVEDAVRPRIGDVVAFARGATALVAPASERTVSRLIGHHGSLTSAELRVPLLQVATVA